MCEAVLGIDIGTSYTKIAVRAEDGTLLHTCRGESPTKHGHGNIVFAYPWWQCIRDVITNALSHPSLYGCRIVAMCISAIAPTLTIFDTAEPERARAILYSSLDNIGSSLQMLPMDEITRRRISTLREVALNDQFSTPCLTDLVGYINWLLTNEITVNVASLAEMSISEPAEDLDALEGKGGNIARSVSVSEIVGSTKSTSASELRISAGVPVCGGCPDTVGSIIGGGLVNAGEVMLYLGTYGSVLSLQMDTETILTTRRLGVLPYNWLLSVPNLGVAVEETAHKWFRDFTNPLQELDRVAELHQPGANGVLFLLPRWRHGVMSVGEFSFVANRNGSWGSKSQRARALLESIAYAAVIVADGLPAVFRASGGGSKSTAWLSSIATVMNRQIVMPEFCWEASGTAEIAARVAWRKPVTREAKIIACDATVRRDIIEDNLFRAHEEYVKRGWI